jgi:hypothetical protein
MKARIAILLVAAFAPCVASAELPQGPTDSALAGPLEPVPPAVVARDTEGHVTIRAIRLAEPLVIDGRLDERLYRETEAIGDFIQQEPREGSPSTDKTEVWVAYDEDAVYVGARLWESDSSQRVTSDMRRDAANLYNNDHFGVMFDTFDDRRNGYVFFANAQGGMSDAQVLNENASADWNTIWETRAADFDGGWTIEFRIPFRSIRFKEDGHVWGINFRRLVSSKTETSYLTHIPASFARNGLMRTSSAATLVGLDTPGRLRNIDVKGYALGSTVTNRLSRPVISNHGDTEFGADIKWGLTQSLIADVTYNTDFAQVEDDEQQVNLTRFSLLFPEKREFFMDGAQFFQFGIQGALNNNADLPAIFFSRRIGLENGAVVPIVFGGRLVGRSGPYRVGFLQMRTGDLPAARAVATDYSVVRVQREFLRRSRIGVIGTRRAPSTGGADSRNYAYGADAVLQFYDNIQMTEYIAKTNSAGRSGDDTSYRSRFNWNPDRWGVDIEHMYAGKNFNPEVGFVRRPDGFRQTHAKFESSPRPRNIPHVRQLITSVELDYFTDPSGHQVTSRTQVLAHRTNFTNGDYTQIDATRSYDLVDEPFDVAKNVRIPVGGYDFTQFRAAYTLGPQRKLSGTATARTGNFYDGTLRELSWKSRVEFSPQLYAEPTISWNRIDVPWGRGNTNLVSSRLTYTISPRMFFSALVQYQSRVDALSTNARFRWEYKPGSEMFVVYNDGRTTLTRGIPDLQNRSIVVKVTRLFQF